MAVHLKWLKVFCDVVRQRSFSRAADENDMSQSAASQLVHQLEERLGVKLIDRSKRPFVLTPEGEVYYDGCRSLLERYGALEDKVRTLHQEVAGCVRVASIYSVGLHHMNRYLQDFLVQHPKANVRLEYLHPHRVFEAVENDLADLGLVSYPKSSRTLTAIPWREEPMVLVCAPTHELAGRPSIGLAQLHGRELIGFDSDLTIRREIDRVLHLHRIEVQLVMEFDNIETIKRAIEIDAGVSLLPEPTVLREVAAGTLVAVPLDTDELVRPLGIIHRRGKQLSATTWRFVELLKREGDRLPAESAAGQSAHPVSVPHLSGQGAAGHGAPGNGVAGQDAKNGKPSHQVVGESSTHASVSAGAPPARGAGNGESASMAECRTAETTVG